MKRIILLLTITLLFVLILAACGAPTASESEPPAPEIEETYPEDEILDEYLNTSDTIELPAFQASMEYFAFEEAVIEFATDVVIAQYVGHRPFGRNLTEFEFVVRERVFGNAADRIFVYTEYRHVDVMGTDVVYRPGDLSFQAGTDYLLPLWNIDSPFANTRENGFIFVFNMVIDLDSPSESIMYSEPLALHTEGLDFNSRSLAREEIVSYMGELAAYMQPARDFVRSDVMEDIIHGSPYVMVIEVNEPFRLAHEMPSQAWGSNDMYYATVLEVLKGERTAEDFEPGHSIVTEIGTYGPLGFVMFFNADTVLPGERHIVAATPLGPGRHDWFELTSRDSLFRMDQLDEILAILGRGVG